MAEMRKFSVFSGLFWDPKTRLIRGAGVLVRMVGLRLSIEAFGMQVELPDRPGKKAQ
jgi:hypothetical protein